MTKSRSQLAGLFVALGLLIMSTAQAAPANPFGYQTDSDVPSYQLAAVPIEAAIRKAKAKYGGKVLSAKEIRSKGPLVYKIKLLLPNGRVKTVFVDGESGEVFEA